ncbi:type I-E CRISPR-associated protein Cas6/Cse3/CasE [Saccharomonospora azurea]|uniref:type I-E CRISPR-associated protein Cas6/Cse3/CasE n=1 Tax=Saccharomonospora azurea TaxID=40988 RepID=UPI00331A798F
METAALTKILTNPNHPRVARDLRDIHRLHQVLTKIACPPDLGPASRAAVGLLYRLERGGSEILLQSRAPLNTDELPAGYLAAEPKSRSLAPLLERLTAGTTVRYKITGNPVASRDGRRLPIDDPEAAVEWWRRTATSRGLTPDTIALTDLHKTSGARNGTRITINTGTFVGVGTVTDADQLREAIVSGIGRARAYGCGLLSVALA